jgi:hypothetical protein
MTTTELIALGAWFTAFIGACGAMVAYTAGETALALTFGAVTAFGFLVLSFASVLRL